MKPKILRFGIGLMLFGLCTVVSAQDYAMSPSAEPSAAPSAGAMAFDLVLVRPLGIAATALGTALFVVNLPLTPFEKDAPAQPFHRLIVDPLKFTFTRPLGAVQ